MKAIQILKKIREWKITILFEEKSLNPQTIKEIDEALEELEAFNTKIKTVKEYCKHKSKTCALRQRAEIYEEVLEEIEVIL